MSQTPDKKGTGMGALNSMGWVPKAANKIHNFIDASSKHELLLELGLFSHDFRAISYFLGADLQTSRPLPTTVRVRSKELCDSV